LTVHVSLILAMAKNGVIGSGGTLPWHLPADLRRFKALTTGHTIIMGRKTYDSVGNPLPNRRNVVLTRDRDFKPADVVVAHDINAALKDHGPSEEVFVIGGADIFRQTVGLADRLYLTLVHADVDGDTSVDWLELSGWDLEADEFHERDEEHECPFSFKVYTRPKQRPAS